MEWYNYRVKGGENMNLKSKDYWIKYVLEIIISNDPDIILKNWPLFLFATLFGAILNGKNGAIMGIMLVTLFLKVMQITNEKPNLSSGSE